MKDDKMKTAYYEAPHFKLYLDDCLNVLAEIPENTIDMIYEIIV
jgi:DNA modification methylase